jgi:flagellar assembly protein FliH
MSSESRRDFAFPTFGGAAAAPVPSAADLFESFDAGKPAGIQGPGGESALDDPRQRIERIEQEAYEKAFLLGERAGREMGEAAVAPLIEKLNVALSELSTLRGTLMREAERELVALSVEIAKAVVGDSVARSPEILMESVRKALSLVGDGGKIVLRVNPGDAAGLWKEREALAPFLGGKGELRVEPNESIERGGCIAVTDFSEADATIAGQCAAIFEALSATREERE